MKKKTTTKKPDIKVFTDKQLIKELEKRNHHVISLKTHSIFNTHDFGYMIVETKEIDDLYEMFYDKSWSDSLAKEVKEKLYDWVQDFCEQGPSTDVLHDMVRDAICELESEYENEEDK